MNTDDKVYTPAVIEDVPFPQEQDQQSYGDSQKSSQDTYQPKTIADQPPPKKRTATELLSSALNTKSRNVLQEFTLTDSGGFRIGKYQTGVSGEVVLTPAGISARNLSGLTTFVLDAETGDAVFSGTIQTGTLVSGVILVGDGSIEINGETDQILVFEGDIAQVLVGRF